MTQIIASYTFTASVAPPDMIKLRPERYGKFEQACMAHGITRHQARSKSRTRDLAHPRQAAMLWLRNNTNLSLPEIGRLFDRDHTTVLHGIRAAEKRANGGEQ